MSKIIYGGTTATPLKPSLLIGNDMEWILDGGDATAEIDFIVDTEVSDTSENAIANKVIKKYVDDKARDYIVAQIIESDGWTYRAWNSGIVECWRNVSITTNIKNETTETGTKIYYSTYNFGVFEYPVSFIENPIVNFTLVNSRTMFIYPSVVQKEEKDWLEKTPNYRLISHYPLNTDREYTGSFYVIGRWK